MEALHSEVSSVGLVEVVVLNMKGRGDDGRLALARVTLSAF
jgi:hypothetical protein